MTDPETKVITDALREEANKKWRVHADQLGRIAGKVTGLDLGDTAFFIGDMNMTLYARAYNDFTNDIETLLKAGQVEYGQMADALIKMANEYDRTDLENELDLRQIYTNMNVPPI
jgi:hypothetical protein